MLELEKIHLHTERAIKWIKEFVNSSGADGVVVGNSGGKDSAVVIAMAVKALGKDRVLTINMPCHSVDSDLEDANIVASKYGVKILNIDLNKCYDLFELEINNVMESQLNKRLINESKVNSKPRFRMTVLYAVAQTMNYLVIGTGNLCESMVGYTTKWGDNSSDFNPIGNFTAEEVIQIGYYLGVPEKILIKSPSDGLGLLTDEEKMGVTYKQISEMIETGDTEKKERIIEMFNKSKHKRDSIPVYKFERTNFLTNG